MLIPIGFFGAGGINSFFASYTGNNSNEEDRIRDVQVDASGNIYVASSISSSSAPTLYGILKLNNKGELLWRYTIYNGSGGFYASRVLVDSAGSVYAVGYTGTSTLTVIKLDSNGTLLWKTGLLNGGNHYGNGLTFDASETYLFVANYNNYNSSSYRQGYYKINTSNGAFVLGIARGYNDTNTFSANGIGRDSSGYYYVGGYMEASGAVSIVKYDGSGGTAWHTGCYISNGGGYGYRDATSSATDINGNTVVVGYSTSYNKALLSRIDSGGGGRWSAVFQDGLDIYWNSVHIGSDGYVYCAGTTINGNKAFWAKYNMSGNLVLQRKFTSSGAQYFYGITTDEKSVYLSGSATYGKANRQGVLYKLPKDGSKTGTYTFNGVSVTYAAGDNTNVSPVATIAPGFGTIYTTSSYPAAFNPSTTVSTTTITASPTPIA